jgi:hypothetical protein
MSGTSPTGLKFELRLLPEVDAHVRYDVALALSDARHQGTATIEPEAGRVAFEWQTAPPEWCENTIRAQLRTLYRERTSGYPRRVTRWRPAPEGAPG